MIWRPPGADYYGWLVGMQWPEGNEDKMWTLADDWKSAATQLNSIKEDIDAAMSAVRLAYPEGDGGDAMLAQLKSLKFGDLSKDGAGSIDSLVKWFDSIGALADNTGTEFEYSKLMFHAMLIIMAIDMAFAAASLFAAPAAEAAVIATNRITARMIMKQLVQKLLGQSVKFAEIAEIKAVLKDLAIKAGLTAAKSAALGAAMGTAPDAAIQAWQRYEGRREKFSWEQVGIMAAAGAVGGVVAAGVGGGLHGLFGTPSKITTRVMTTGVTMLAAGGSAGLAGWGASALITGNHEFDPRMITAGMWGGAAPGAIRAASPKGHAPTLAHPTTEFKSQPAPTKPSGIETPANTSEGVPITPAHVSDGAGLSSDTPHAGDTEAGKQNPVVAAAAPPAPANPVVHNEVPGGQVTNDQNAAPAQPAHQQPNSPGTTGPKLADGVQSSAAPHTSGDVKPAGDGRPAPAAAPRAEPGSTTPADTSRAGAAPTREPAGPAAPVQAKATGLEAGSRGNERLDAVPNDRAQVPASERLEGRIGGRHDDVTGGQHPNHDGTPARDEHRSGRINDDAAQNERNPKRDNDTAHDGRPGRDGQPEHNGQPGRDGQPEHNGQPSRDGQPERNGQPSRDGQPEHDSQPNHDQQPSHLQPAAPSHPAPHSVLPVDHPITAAERTHAADALAKLGHEVEALLHLDDVDQAGAHQKARDNHNWWHDLTPDEQGAVMRVHPHEIGNADGIPPHARDQANRLSIARDLTELRERNPRVDKWTSRWTDPEGRQQFKNLQSTIHNLEHAETLADNFANRDRVDPNDPPGHRPPVHVLSYDSKAFNGEGRAVVAIGDVDKASTVSWHIPGITTTVRSLEVNLNNAFHHYEATSDNVHDPGMVASIAWIGYDAPSGSRIGREMTNPALAQRGGQLLARDVAAFNQTRKINAGLPGGEPMPDVHLFGHSYGSTTTSYAGAGGRLTGEVSTITLLGSPGAGPVVHASEFGLGEGNVFVASSSRDPVTWIGSSAPGEIARAAPGLGMGLGMDPSVEAFGARRITAQFPGGAQTFSNIGTHTGYYKFHDDAHTVPSESLHNFAKIAAGDSGNVIPEFARPDHEGLNAWQRNIGSFPSDPAHLRPPIFDPHEGPPIGYEHLVEEFRNPDPTPDHPTLPADHQPVNDCGPQALRHAQELTGNENIRIPHDPDIAERGMSARDLEDAAGARMQLMDSPGVLADHLNRLGEGATAIVVAEFHGPTDINGIGAHAYTVTNDGGRLVVHDSALGTGPHPFSPNNPNIRSTHALLFDSHGNPVHPIDSGTPSHPNAARPEARIGQAEPHGAQPAHEQPHTTPDQPQKPATPNEQIRRFESDEAGRQFGEETMSHIRDSLSPEERHEVNRYTRHSWINELMRDPDPNAMFTALSEDYPLQRQLMRLNENKSWEPPLELLKSYENYPHLDEPLQTALNNVLHDVNPQHRLNELWSNAEKFIQIRENLGTEPTAEILNNHVQALDQATSRPVPEGFQATRGMGHHGIDHLIIDEHGTTWDGGDPRQLINTVQTERGYLSTSLADAPPTNFKTMSVRMELDIPADSKGLWIGDRSGGGSENEFLLPRGTRYLITDVVEFPGGAKYENVEYLVKGIVVGADYVHDPAVMAKHTPPHTDPVAHESVARDPKATSSHEPLDSATPPKQEPEPVGLLTNLHDETAPAPTSQPVIEHPPSLTAELKDQFKEIRALVSEIVHSSADPARYSELPQLQKGLAHVLERTGIMDPEKYTTPWHLLGEHDPGLKQYLSDHGNALLNHSPEPRAAIHSNEAQPHQDPNYPVDHSELTGQPFPAKVTEAGASFHPDDPTVGELAARIAKDPNYFTADVHLGEDGHARIGGRTYTPEEFANLLRQTNWDGRTPIRLVGCDAAVNGFAARLAQHLGVEVMAPTKPAWSDSYGRLYTSTAEEHPGGTRRPRIPPDGTWETHHPDGTKTKASDDGFAPGTPEDHKFGLDPADAVDRSAPHNDEESSAREQFEPTVHPESPFADAFDPPELPVVHEIAAPDLPFSFRTDLLPDTLYEVEGRGLFWTDETGLITHAELKAPNLHNSHNPDVRHMLPDTSYRVHTEHGDLTFETNEHGEPPRAALYEPPRNLSRYEIGTSDGPRNATPHEVNLPDPPRPGEGFVQREDLPPNAEITVHDTSGNYVGTYYTDDSGTVRHMSVESGRQYRIHPELGRNVDPGIKYRLSPDFDINSPRDESASFVHPQDNPEIRVVLKDDTATAAQVARDPDGNRINENQLKLNDLSRRPSAVDPFIGRTLEPNRTYVVEIVRSKKIGLEPYGIFYTDNTGKVMAVDTFKPFNQDLISPPAAAQIRVENGPTVINTREAVGQSPSYVGPHALSHEPNYDRSPGKVLADKMRRDNTGQANVAARGRAEFPPETYEDAAMAGGHAARNAESLGGEDSHQVPQLDSQNSGRNLPPDLKPNSWYKMEDARVKRARSGVEIGPINLITANRPDLGTPVVMWQVWTETPLGGRPEVWIRSYWNVPAAAVQ